MEQDKSETNVLAWILDSVDIIHALLKWNVNIKIQHPDTLEKERNIQVDSILIEIYNRMAKLQAALMPKCSNASVEISHSKMNITHLDEKGGKKMQVHYDHGCYEPPRNQRSYSAPDWIIYSLDVLLHVTETGVFQNLNGPDSFGLSSSKASTLKQLKRLHKRFITIHSKAYSLKYQGCRTKRQSSHETAQYEQPQTAKLNPERDEKQQQVRYKKESEMEATNVEASEKIKTLENKIQSLTTAFEDIKKSKLDSDAQIKQLKKEKDELLQEPKEHHHGYANQRKDQSKNDEYGNSNRQTEMLQKKVNELTEAMKKLAQEKNAIQKRLSEAFSAQLKDNNPALADLSDAWRPTVIAEKFNLLYDDEWTDGFQVLSQIGKSEKESIQTLFDILKNCYEFCVSKSKVQIENVTKALISFESTKQNERMRSPDLDSIPRVTLNELRRQTCVMSKDTVINKYIDEGHTAKEKNMEFVKKCLELSWYMVLQTPPVYMDVRAVYTKGSHLNKDLFKPYSRTGTTIDFVVWPPLYLKEGGPLLAKGVAQPVA